MFYYLACATYVCFLTDFKKIEVINSTVFFFMFVTSELFTESTDFDDSFFIWKRCQANATTTLLQYGITKPVCFTWHRLQNYKIFF